MKYKLYSTLFTLIVGIILFQSCKSTKHVPDGKYLLENASVKSDKKVIPEYEMEAYIKQKPNFKTFTIFKLPLFLYNLSGKDSTTWVNRVLRKAGDPPVIYDSTMVGHTVTDLKRMMTNKGYLNAVVTPQIDLKNKKARITYDIKAGQPYLISDYKIEVSDTVISEQTLPAMGSRNISKKRSSTQYLSTNVDTILYRNSLVRKNAPFDLDILDMERDRITSILRQAGYFGFNKEYIGFEADTTVGINEVNLNLNIYPFTQRVQNTQGVNTPHRQYTVKDVELLVDYNPLVDGNRKEYPASSIYEKNGYKIIYGVRGEYIKPHIILHNCYIVPGTLYNENLTTQTYSALSQLKILKNVNISYTEFIENDSTKLHCVITCVPDKRQGTSTEVEGTYSGGYFGMGAGLGYLHRNAFRGSELFNVKVRGAYEAITPKFSSFNDNYFEIGGETSLTFPRFLFPFLNKDFRQRVHASTQFNSSFTFQRRPKYFTRTVSAAGVKYIWQDRRQSFDRHAFDLIDFSYIHLPENDLNKDFYNQLSAATQRYSFSDHFILGAGYSFSRTNLANVNKNSYQPLYSLRASVETAGNLLALGAVLSGAKSDEFGSKKLFGTNFAQYARATADYSRTYQMDEKNSFAWHIGGGIAYPYGNMKQIPIQKRFFSGGANSVRGWAIRELGPGSYYFRPTNNVNDKDNFYYHSGDIRLDASLEYRSKLFWVLELGAFIDAGNIWTINSYQEQPDGMFKLNKFYKEIAVAWGMGLRFDFDYVLVRLDCGWKAYDPTNDPNATTWPVFEPHKFRKNTSLHIAIGYPF